MQGLGVTAWPYKVLHLYWGPCTCRLCISAKFRRMVKRFSSSTYLQVSSPMIFGSSVALTNFMHVLYMYLTILHVGWQCDSEYPPPFASFLLRIELNWIELNWIELNWIESPPPPAAQQIELHTIPNEQLEGSIPIPNPSIDSLYLQNYPVPWFGVHLGILDDVHQLNLHQIIPRQAFFL